MKNLPIGIQTFSEIINKNCFYVDKTKDILNLINSGKYYFLSRPRRFGKSLLTSTLKEIFSGNKELFKGLYIYDKIEWEKYPVIHIDFSEIDYSNGLELEKNLIHFIEKINIENSFNTKNVGLKSYFSDTIKALSKKNNAQIVILIDEYDKPIIEHILNKEIASENRNILRNFFGVIKSCDQYLKFVFITGISKFTQVSIFSTLNNLKDLTLSPSFSTILGITEKELEFYFDEHINNLSKIEKKTKEETLLKIKTWYNGYSWDSVNKVYNPFSILNLFSEYLFSNYWFETGTPTFLINLLKEKKYAIPEIENCTATSSTFNNFDIDNLTIIALLFQTGYITIKNIHEQENGKKVYGMGYPNFEVKDSLINQIMSSFVKMEESEIQPIINNMIIALKQNDIIKFITLFKSFLAGIPYTIEQKNEAYYHTIFYITAYLFGAKIDPEVLTNQGRIDGVLEFSDKIYIIEFKYRKEIDDLNKLAEIALNQIKDKKYYEKYLSSNKKIYLLGVAFVDKEIGYKLEEVPCLC